MASPLSKSERVLVLAPTGADAMTISSVLNKAGVAARSCRNAEEAGACVDAGAGALLLTEEAVVGKPRAILAAALGRQPAWSDLPVIVVASHGSLHRWSIQSADALGARSNVTLVERPLQASILIAAAKAVLRARQRQYQIRDLLSEREALLGSLEKRVRERTSELQELVAELESFSYSVSHDLRAPLRVMAGYASTILEDHLSMLTPPVRNYVQRIAKSAEKMDRLTQDVLTYTRLSRGEISLETVDLDAALHDLIDLYPDLSEARASIVIQETLGSVVAHGPSLTQALSNLIGNALKFKRPDVVPRVEISTRARGNRIQIVVKDNGIGIELAHHRKIFDIFERLADQKVPGTGIGLAIVKRAVKRMAGTVGVRSQIGKGSEFWIELPKPTHGKTSSQT